MGSSTSRIVPVDDHSPCHFYDKLLAAFNEVHPLIPKTWPSNVDDIRTLSLRREVYDFRITFSPVYIESRFLLSYSFMYIHHASRRVRMTINEFERIFKLLEEDAATLPRRLDIPEEDFALMRRKGLAPEAYVLKARIDREKVMHLPDVPTDARVKFFALCKELLADEEELQQRVEAVTEFQVEKERYHKAVSQDPSLEFFLVYLGAHPRLLTKILRRARRK